MKIHLNESHRPLTKKDIVAIDTELYGMNPDRLHWNNEGKFASMQYTFDGENIYVVDQESGVQGAMDLIIDAVHVFHNAYFDVNHLRRWCIYPDKSNMYDTLLTEKLLFSGYYDSFGLADLVRRYFGDIREKETREEFAIKSTMTKEMLEYSALDAFDTYRVFMKQKELLNNRRDALKVWKVIDQPALYALVDLLPVYIDIDEWNRIAEENEKKALEIKLEAEKRWGINIGSTAQVQKILNARGFKVDSSGEKILHRLAKRKQRDDFVEKVLEYRYCSKRASTYGKTMAKKFFDPDGTSRPGFNVSEAMTGRMSCVSGDTLLATNRGTFRIDEYIPQIGDTIQTHTGEWKPIIRKILKGVGEMLRVECSDGSVVQCTSNHRLYTPSGWKYVKDLYQNSEVIGYVSKFEIYKQQREYRKGSVSIFGRSTQAQLSRNCRRAWNNLSQYIIYSKIQCRKETQKFREKLKNVKIQNRKFKSYVWKKWGITSQLCGRNRKWEWIPTSKKKWKISLSTPLHYGKSLGSKIYSKGMVCSSHRREQNEQQHRQFGFSYKCGTPQFTQKNTTIRRITPVGTMEIWDIEVADNHSYCAGGLIHHNSSKFNLQNIPAEEKYRACIVASPDCKILVTDYSAQEPRITAYESQDKLLIKMTQIVGESIHVSVGRELFNDPNLSKKDRRYKAAKGCNLGIQYGLTAVGLQRDLNDKKEEGEPDVSREEAQQLLNQYFSKFPGVKTWANRQRSFVKSLGYVTTKMGRRAYLNQYDWKAGNNALNSPIQGGAADITKLALSEIRKESYNRWGKWFCFGVVHDEIDFNVPNEIFDEHKEMVEKIMIDCAERIYTGITFEVESKWGINWSCKMEEE